MTNADMRNMQDHYPQRDDQVEAWIKDRRDLILEATPLGQIMLGWDTLNKLLEEYQEAADKRMSLENVVNGESDPDSTPRAKKKSRINKES